MASAIASARARASSTLYRRPLPGRPLPGSRLGRLIVFLNLLSLAILVVGALVLNEARRGLVEARQESLTVQGQLIAELIALSATRGEPEPAFSPFTAAEILQRRFIPQGQRARLFDADGALILDSYTVSDAVDVERLPPVGRPSRRPRARTRVAAEAALGRELAAAQAGRTISQVRLNRLGERVVSVSIPIRHVRQVLGVLTLEAGDFDEIVAAQRRALLPFIFVAIGVSLLSSLLLAQFIARPIDRLAHAADRVRLSGARAISLPGLARRDDEIGDLTRSLQDMTAALSQRMDAIEAFAADVAHEIRNPLTSIRSAVETLELVREDSPRVRLLAILKQDVQRLDRLITDISNASRLDAELSRDAPRAVELDRQLGELAASYADTRRAGEARVCYQGATGAPVFVSGREGPLSQVFRNLIDNARSFSPGEAEVVVRLRREGPEAVIAVEDQGPGVPPENLETIFERFYTSRPKGTAFGGNSGLGLSIARQIVLAHRGRIWAENRLDAEGRVQGARFQVALPVGSPPSDARA